VICNDPIVSASILHTQASLRPGRTTTAQFPSAEGVVQFVSVSNVPSGGARTIPVDARSPKTSAFDGVIAQQ
jgi:hypothetical protein